MTSKLTEMDRLDELASWAKDASNIAAREARKLLGGEVKLVGIAPRKGWRMAEADKEKRAAMPVDEQRYLIFERVS
ncbi:hypothetical protein LCGC14_0273100 [marine sediment metagenome]|uniref:Uncharacterized protein n=2 Tax=root TaxID=1 RepID=A0A9C9TFY1_9HYPH|nr:hypothetical protein [Aurantimonas coralicida]